MIGPYRRGRVARIQTWNISDSRAEQGKSVWYPRSPPNRVACIAPSHAAVERYDRWSQAASSLCDKGLALHHFVPRDSYAWQSRCTTYPRPGVACETYVM